jgi:ABC-type proline/glycine betaine transport system ATPase subunit
MKDGRIVQIGTPEEVVTNPADAYVARFVQGISRLKLVRAARDDPDRTILPHAGTPELRRCAARWP